MRIFTTASNKLQKKKKGTKIHLGKKHTNNRCLLSFNFPITNGSTNDIFYMGQVCKTLSTLPAAHREPDK